MGKILVIRKPDRTIHKVALENKPALMSFSSRLSAGQKWKFEEMEEEEAAKLPFIDNNYVSPAEAQDKLSEAQREVALLKKQLADALKKAAEQEPKKPQLKDSKGHFIKAEPMQDLAAEAKEAMQ